MQHWFVSDTVAPPAAWREAIPDARFLLRGAVARQPDCAAAVVWMRLHADAELEGAMALMRAALPAAVVILCDQPSEEGAAAAIAAGAAGYCNTHAAPEVLRQVALVVANGGLWIGRNLMQRLIGGTSRIAAQRQPGTRERWSDKLSEREREVARLVAGGASNKEIAERLAITERTVKAHLGAIFEKLDVRDRLQLSLRVNGVPV